MPKKEQFKKLHSEFEKKQTDLGVLQESEGFSRYLLIRTLDKESLKELIQLVTGEVPGSKSYSTLYEVLFMTKVTLERVESYIREKYPLIRKERVDKEKFLPNILSGFKEVYCGVRNDNLNDLAHTLVRDKTIETYAELQTRLNDIIENKIKGYIEWQYFNQATNDLIENFINDSSVVIPTLRKIKYVDFIIKVDGKYIPFDLKITHISDDYFDMLSRGLELSTDVSDNFEIGKGESESKIIKKVYSSLKSKYKLPNYGGLKKHEIIKNLKSGIPQEVFMKHYSNFIDKRLQLIEKTKSEVKKLEWWNYKFQGERLFKNNNRFFVFLVYNDSFEDARPLKKNYLAVGPKITNKLNSVANGSIHKIKYKYEKDPSVNGEYTINAFSVLVSGDQAQ